MNNETEHLEQDFLEYLECEYESLGGTRYEENDFYECPGGHICHIDDIRDEWNRKIENYNKDKS